MFSQKKSPVLNIAITIVLVMGMCGCDKSEGIVSSEDTLTSVTAEVVDMELAHNVKIALAREENLADADITVLASNGEVRLTGVVDNQEQHDQVLRVVHGVAGVTVVDDKLNVKEQK